MAPVPNTAMFMAMVWAPFLARTKPVSSRANPACMNITSAAPTTIQSRFVFWVNLSAAESGSGATSWAKAELANTVTSTAAMPALTSRRFGSRSLRLRRRGGRVDAERDPPPVGSADGVVDSVGVITRPPHRARSS